MSQLSRQVKAILSDAGWKFLRQGKGDHELWHHPETGQKVIIDHSLKSRHTVNAILKQAGLPKAL